MNTPDAGHRSFIKEYWEGICSGDILVGRRIKQQIELLLRDFENPEVTIDLEDSARHIKFIENECKLYEAPFAGKPFILELFQKAIIESIFAIKVWNEEAQRLVRKYQDVLIIIGRKNGKALALDTHIPTPAGWVEMRDIKVGDKVFAVDGSVAEVLRVSPIRYDHDCYRVTFEDGASIVADAEHIWTVTTKKKRQPFDITTAGMVHDFKHQRFLVPGLEPEEYPAEHLTGRRVEKAIVSIEQVPSVPVKCIGIDHPSQLFLAGDRFTATHNSPLTAAIMLSEWFCGEMGTKILIGSNDYDQADIMYSACDAMREESKKLSKCTRRTNKGIFFGNRKQKKTHGKFTKQNKGSIRKISAKGNNKEGRNIKIGAVDEVHEMPDNHLVMPIRQALSTQDEPLYFEITTEGFTDDGYLDERLADAARVLDGELERPNFLIWWYCQDSEAEVWQDETSWVKSNPGLGAIKKWSFLRGMVDEAKTSASTRSFVLAKDFNIKQNAAAAWLDTATITNLATFDIERFKGCYYIGGLDFAETTDLCAARIMFEEPETRKKYTIQMYFIPEAKADAMLEEDSGLNPERKNYRAWEREGLVTICPGNEVDAAMVAGWFIQMYEQYRMTPFKIGFDNWHSKDFQEIIASYFGREVLERIGMDFMSLSGPMRAMESDMQVNNFVYNNNAIDRWCFTNTAYKTNNIGLIMPVKKYGTSKNRIDGTLSAIICYATYGRFKAVYRDTLQLRM